jgi:uncharacterized protein YecE (DUF72 family)
MATYIGTSGWCYKEWRGSFYPEGFASKKMLRYYAAEFDAVEVNNSFYRMPSEAVLAGWSEQVPETFRFVVKASRRITHTQRLRDEDGSLSSFLQRINALGPRLGPTLFQLPPTFTADLPRLHAFLERLPRRWPAALEFRHPSWFVKEVYELMRRHNVPLVAVDSEDDEEGGAPLVATATWGYLRLRRIDYSLPDLELWADRIRQQRWTEAYVFLKHKEGSPAGPAAARGLKTVFASSKGDEDHDSCEVPALP